MAVTCLSASKSANPDTSCNSASARRAAGWELARELLDHASRAGVSVLWASGVHYGKWAANYSDPLQNASLRGLVAEIGAHPALAGYYGCDDCCNTGRNREPNPNPDGTDQLFMYARVRRERMELRCDTREPCRLRGGLGAR